MTQIPNPTTPSVDIPNPDVDDGGRIRIGSPGADRTPGTSGSDNISVLSGDDFVAAGGGNDVVALGGGSDTAGGGTGNDSIQGNRGDDSISGGAGDDSLRGGRDNDTLDGGEGNDILFGDRGDDVVRGGGGNDLILGGLGVDFLEGGDGNDTIQGGKGSDSLNGGAGNDFLAGERGGDVLTGGAGADDFFLFYSTDGSYGVDTLTDFNSDEGDRIVLGVNLPVPENASFSALAGTPSGSPLPAGEFAVIDNFIPSTQGDNPAAIIYDPVNGLVYYNPTGTIGDEDQILQVDPNTPIDPNSFEIF